MQTNLVRTASAVSKTRGQTDVRLIADHLAGDKRALGKLYAFYAPRLVDFFKRRIGDEARSEDLVQETFLRVARHATKFDDTRLFSTWIYGIASNLAKNENRNGRRRRNVFVPLNITPEERGFALDGEIDPTLSPDLVMEKEEMYRLLERAIDRLPRDARVLILLYREGYKYAELASMLKVKKGTVASRLKRAKVRLAEMLRPII